MDEVQGNEDEQETQEHIEECTGCEFERKGLDIENRKDKLKLWARMTAKLENRNRGM